VIAICRNSDCAKSEQCLRYAEKNGETMLFKNICNEYNHYVWFWKNDEIITTTENKAGEESVQK